MLELIDQSDSDRLVYRCPRCLVTGISIAPFATDGYFWDGSTKPGKWVRHKCEPVVAPAPRKAKDAKVEA